MPPFAVFCCFVRHVADQENARGTGSASVGHSPRPRGGYCRESDLTSIPLDAITWSANTFTWRILRKHRTVARAGAQPANGVGVVGVDGA